MSNGSDSEGFYDDSDNSDYYGCPNGLRECISVKTEVDLKRRISDPDIKVTAVILESEDCDLCRQTKELFLDLHHSAPPTIQTQVIVVNMDEEGSAEKSYDYVFEVPSVDICRGAKSIRHIEGYDPLQYRQCWDDAISCAIEEELTAK